MSAPKISVVMAVYNADEGDLRESVESILGQRFSDFEFILIDDGSTNGCGAVLEDYAAKDSRIRLIRHDNIGLTCSLNIGAGLARGELMARQDADDASYPDRFEKQVALFADETVVLAGGRCDDVYEDGYQGVWRDYDENEVNRIVFWKTPFAHSTAMMRTSVFRSLGGYDETFVTAQDMELWMRMARAGRLAMVREPVLKRKVGGAAISKRRRWRQFYDGLRARWWHNRGMNRMRAVYYAVRGVMIGLLPPRLLFAFKTLRGS